MRFVDVPQRLVVGNVATQMLSSVDVPGLNIKLALTQFRETGSKERPQQHSSHTHSGGVAEMQPN